MLSLHLVLGMIKYKLLYGTVRTNMKIMNKIERKLGKYAIPNLSLYLIICYGFGFLMQTINADFFAYLLLDPFLIIKGQVWRLFTWILIPPLTTNIFFTLIMLYFYYSIGTTLERKWGVFYYNLYLFSGMIFTIIGSFVVMGIAMALNIFIMPLSFSSFSTYYINMSIFLAFAATFPEMQILLMFIIPVKVKWLGIIYGVILIVEAFSGGVITRFAAGASLLNFIIFFLSTRKKMYRSPKQIHRQHVYKKEVHQASNVTRHKCAICGRTEQEYPDLEFRFCSKCDGNYEYCQEHLFTHEHIKRH